MFSGRVNNSLSTTRHLSYHPAWPYCVFSYLLGLGLRFCSCTRMVPAAQPTAWRLYGRQAVAISHSVVGLTIFSEWWQTTLLFVVQCCLCSSKRQSLCIPTISGRFVSSSLHIYPACSHCTAFLTPKALCFNCNSCPACIWLGFVSTERQGHYTLQLAQLLVRYTLQLTQLLVGIFETMIVIQIKQAKELSNSSR